MTRRALDRHEHVDAAAVAKRDLQAGTAEHRHIGADSSALDDALDRIMLAGFARETAGEQQPAGDRHTAGNDGLHRMQHRGEIGFLLARAFAHDAFARESKFLAIDDVAIVGVWHGGGWLVHRIANEHERLAARSRTVTRDQVSHRIVADVQESHRSQTWLDRRLDELFEERFVFEQFGLRARHFDQFDQQLLGALA